MGDYIAAAQVTGYTYVIDKTALQTAVAGGASRLLGLFRSGYMTPEILRASRISDEPHLTDMAAAAIDTLDRLNDRFFVMIEGGLDRPRESRRMARRAGREVSAFDDAVGVVLDWINASEEEDGTRC